MVTSHGEDHKVHHTSLDLELCFLLLDGGNDLMWLCCCIVKWLGIVFFPNLPSGL
jgi:hypothetical protein